MSHISPNWKSGLPGGDLLAEAEAGAVLGLAQLDALKRWAQAEADAQRPATQNRFDGVERVEASAAAIEAVRQCDGVVRLVEGLLRDKRLARRAALIMQGRP